VSIAITEEHAALGASVRRFLAAASPPEVGRAGLDSPAPDRPPFWADAAALGWLGLDVGSPAGTGGLGLPEAAVVLEEMGRAAAPGPFLATLAAAALLSAARATGAGGRWAEGLADGTVVGAAAFPSCAPLAARPAGPGSALEISGTTGPVLSGGAATVWLVPVRPRGSPPEWVAVPGEAGQVTVLESLDPTRPVATLTLDGHRVEGDARLGLGAGEVATPLSPLVAGECAGGAAWCLETAVEHAKVRVQFGRPIGQFQAVKHRAAEMLIAVEQIRAAAWDAADAVQEDRTDRGNLLAAGISAAVGPALYLRAAEDCIQLLGGIGFTWEHDAHRHLRRAATLVALFGPAAGWRREVATLAASGARRSTRGGGTGPEHDGLRSEVRAEVAAVAARPREERRVALVQAGLLVPHWPRPWGRSAGAVEQLIIDEELAAARIRRPNLAVGAWAAPTIATHGTPEQQERWVGPTLRGEISWCQLFSEPEAGSDLASLRTRATRDEEGRGWRLDGQKVWTSLAREADFGICLARTDPTAPRHLGITYFVVDMRTPGIDVRPLRELTGHAMFNEVFLDGVLVPDDCVIGPVGGGWALARTTLANERVAMGSGASFGGGMEALLGLVGEIGADRLDPVDVDRLGALLGESHCLSVMGRRSAWRAVAGAGPGPEASVRKLLGAEHDQRVQEFGLALLGPAGASTQGAGGQWSFGFLANRCLTIAGGTSEVQRNVIAERLLGLPRDPEPGG
jgi:alkylation response protein AidB-like acyl-CoA dehydrogenase